VAAGRVGRRTVRTNPAQHRAGADSIELHHESSKANARPCAAVRGLPPVRSPSIAAGTAPPGNIHAARLRSYDFPHGKDVRVHGI